MTSALANLELEQAVLGALIGDTSGTLWPQISQLLKPEHFSEPLHARLFELISIRLAAGQAISMAVLRTLTADDQALNEIGGNAYIAQLVSNTAPAIALRSHAELLRDLAARRQAVDVANDLTASAITISTGETFRPALAAHIENLQQLFDDSASRKTSYAIGDAVAATASRVRRIRSGEVDRNAVKTGIPSIDSFTGGLHRGEYVVLGGRPSMGKTALAVQLAYNTAEAGGGVFYASLEMPVALITPRFVSTRLWMPNASSELGYQRILRGQVSDRELNWIESVSEELRNWPLVIDDAPGLSPSELEARAQVTKSRFERAGRSLDLIVVDHLHKMRQPGTTSKVTEYTEISARLAEMAKRLDCPVLALAQLNRSVESRDDKRPQLADLRESGSIEQDADTVLFCYRPVYYLERQRFNRPDNEADRLAAVAASKHKMELLVEKQRSGPIGTINLWADMATNVVRDPSAGPMEMAA